MNREVIIFPSRSAWLEGKTKFLSSTEVSALFPGCNGYLSEAKLWFLKYTGQQEVRKVTQAMSDGLAAEPTIARNVSTQRGWKARPYPPFMFLQCPEKRLGSSVDWELPELRCPLELKKMDAWAFMNGSWQIAGGRIVKVSPYVDIQLNTQMLVGGFDHIKLGVQVGLNRFYSGDWLPNPTLQKMIVARTDEFWESIDRGWAPRGVKRLKSVNLSVLPAKILTA